MKKMDIINRYMVCWKEYGRRVFISTAIAYITAYYYMLISEPINADWLTLGFLKYHGAYWYDQIGRWGRRYAETLFYKVNNPLISHLICYLSICLASMILISLWNIRGRVFQILIGPTLTVSPAIVDTTQFFHDVLFYSLALLLSAIAALIVTQYSSKKSLAVAILSIIISISLYQPYLNSYTFIVAGTVLLSILRNNDNDKERDCLKMTIRGIIAFLIGCIGYFGMWKIITCVRHTPKATYAGVDTIDDHRSLGVIWTQIKAARVDFCTYYSKDHTLLLNIFWYGVLFITAICIVYLMIGKIRKKEYLNAILASLIIYLFPVLSNPVCIVARSNGGPRGEFMCQLMIPLCVGIFSESMQNVMQEKSRIYHFAYVALILCITGIYMGQWTKAYSSVRTWDIGNRITRAQVQHALQHAIEDERYTKGMPIVFMGIPDMSFAQEMNPLHEYAYNDPYVIWDCDKDMAILGDWRKYVAYYVGFDIGTISDVEYEEILRSEKFNVMEEYPSFEAYSVIDGKYVILFDRETVGY